ncbi:hypothetical protein [Clostridium rectalis]|nr:hypothetical protein [Clostridium rectalis]
MYKIFCSICCKDLKNCICKKEVAKETKIIEPEEIKNKTKKSKK